MASPPNDQPQYTVKQAAELTGLSHNQVRLWERRYNLVTPQRAENGYRLYSQQDLDILRYVLQRAQAGHPIHQIAEDVAKNKAQILAQTQPKLSPSPKPIQIQALQEIPNYDLMLNAIQMDNPLKFEQLLIQAQSGRSFAESIRSVDLPVLAKLGELSMTGKIPIIGPHIASAIIRRRIMAHVQNLGLPTSGEPVVLACAPNDFHEVGLLYCWMALTEQLVPTLYLGPHVPIDELVLMTQKLRPASVLIALSAPQKPKDLNQLISEIQTKLLPRMPVALGGYEAIQQKTLLEKANLPVLEDVQQIFNWKSLRTPASKH